MAVVCGTSCVAEGVARCVIKLPVEKQSLQAAGSPEQQGAGGHRVLTGECSIEERREKRREKVSTIRAPERPQDRAFKFGGKG